jgi:cytochrome b subunit of formate dehydrogenase
MTQPNAIQNSYRRFSAAQRFEHFILLVTFLGLALTGIPQKYAIEPFAQHMIHIMGGIESVRIIHRVLATILMIESIYHGGIITYKVFILGKQITMLPGIRDGRDALHWIAFNLGLRSEHPHLPRFNFGEKAEYLAVVWGTIIMIVTGFMMWNPIATANWMPAEVVPSAKAAHGAEAVLAMLAIITWHMYNVHLKRFNRSIFTGQLSHEEMEEEHGEELQAILSGDSPPDLPAEVIKRRRLRFMPIAVVISGVLLATLYTFVTVEKTAIDTVPRQEIGIYVPDFEVSEGNPAVGEALWPTLRCSFCHGLDAVNAQKGPELAGIDLSFEEFLIAVRSGNDIMPAFSKGEIPDSYMLHLWTWLSTASDT